jgi:hypothetical protein
MRFKITALCALAASLSITAPAVASTSGVSQFGLKASHHHAVRHHHVCRVRPARRHHRAVRCIKHVRHRQPVAVAAAPVTMTDPTLLGMGDVYALGCQNLPLRGASVVRVVVGSYDDPQRWLACAESAKVAGYRVFVTIQYDNGWDIGYDAYRLSSVLALYAPYAWAVAVGNEEELPTTGDSPQSGAQYATTWQLLEPIVASMAPDAIRVAGEVGPWGMRFIRDAVAAGLPGAQALSGHVYPGDGANLDPAAFAQLARSAGLQPWATEGMCGPGAWTQYGCRPADQMQRNGFAVSLEWFVPPVADAWLG